MSQALFLNNRFLNKYTVFFYIFDTMEAYSIICDVLFTKVSELLYFKVYNENRIFLKMFENVVYIDVNSNVQMVEVQLVLGKKLLLITLFSALQVTNIL